MSAREQPVAPDSVHVWRGFKAQQTSYADFTKFLGSVFVPACALLQPNSGLRAYVPSMVPQSGKPATVPDQTALMFWATQQAYQDAFKTVAVRAYTNLHGGAYDTKRSSAQFAVALTAQVIAEQPYYLFDRPVDWMLGNVRHFIGARPAAQSSSDFLEVIGNWAAMYQKQPADVDGALLCAGADYVVFWEHRASPQGAALSLLGGLARLSTPCLDKIADNYVMPAGLWQPWTGIDLTQNDCINIQLARPEPDAGGEIKR